MFETKAVVEKYGAGDISKSIVASPDWMAFYIKHYEVHAQGNEFQNRLKKASAA